MVSLGEIGYNFNFPFISEFDPRELKCGRSACGILIKQYRKINEECNEMNEECKHGDIDSIAFETMNIIQACETMLHLLACIDGKCCFTSNNFEYCDYEIIDEAKRKTYEENKRRGYYD